MVQSYVGQELDLFAQANTWKGYLARLIRPYLDGDVLEVGAGIGATTAAFCRPANGRWVCLEPDPDLAARIGQSIDANHLPARCEVRVGTLESLPHFDKFGAILYIDVLEHIANDEAELSVAAAHLKPGGALVIMAPAHQWLFSEFDAAIGHYRRYCTNRLRGLAPKGLVPVLLHYVDCAGLLASAGNRFLLRSHVPTPRHIAFWDRFLIPVSEILDPLLRFRFGKSVFAVWRAPLEE
jgi:SAM-dependent methyltransferase